MSIPYGHQEITDEDVAAVAKTLKSDYLTTGPKVAEFEAALCRYVGAAHAVAVNSGTSALDIAVAALELPAGSEIITTPFSFVASANCALYNGCTPVFADIDRKTYNIDAAQIRKKITAKTKAMVYVDYAGQPCEIGELKEIADKHGLALIEDAAHALGAEYKGKRVGGFADMTCFSFHPVKHITTGEGGAVTTERGELAETLRMLRNHGIDKTPSERATYLYDMKLLGRNYRITDFQCALGISQLKRMNGNLKRREEIAELYAKELAGLPLALPYVASNARHAWHLYTVLLDKGINRDAVFDAMRKRGIGVNVHYIPPYKFSYYQKLGYGKESDYPVTEEIYSRILTLPMYHSLKDEEIRAVAAALEESIKEAKQ